MNEFKSSSKLRLQAKPQQFEDGLPRSVRDAPTELRAAIRRRQNNESARRCRERERDEIESMDRKYEENQDRIRHLENAVDQLTAVLSKPSSEGSSSRRQRKGNPHHGAPF